MLNHMLEMILSPVRFRMVDSVETFAEVLPSRTAGRMADRADYIKGSVRRAESQRSAESANRAIPNSDLISQEIAARSTEALGQLYDLMGRRAFGLAYTVTGDATLAEDAVQDAFLSLWRQAESVSHKRGKIESLLLTMVHRRAVDHVRKRARSDRANSALEFEGHKPEIGDPEQQAVENTEQANAVTALKGLPHEQKQVIELAYFRGLTQREIADETGVSLGTVKGRMRLGLEKLRSAFGLGEERS